MKLFTGGWKKQLVTPCVSEETHGVLPLANSGLSCVQRKGCGQNLAQEIEMKINVIMLETVPPVSSTSLFLPARYEAISCSIGAQRPSHSIRPEKVKQRIPH